MKQGVTDEYGDFINPPGVTDEYGDFINHPGVTDEYGDFINHPGVTDEYGDFINHPTQTPRNGNYISMIIVAVILLAVWLNYENGMTDPNVESPMDIVSADFSASPTSGNAPLIVTFTDQSTGSPTSWNWNFGDGSDPVNEYNPTHTYSTAGSYTVEETVSNEAGEDTEIKTIYVTAESPMNSLSADFSASPTSGEAPLIVTFTDQSTGSPTSWNWDFGDKITTSAKRNPTHTYEEAGVYTVKETVTNGADENTKSKTNYITVMPSEDADSSMDTDTSVDTGASVDTDTSVNTDTSASTDSASRSTGTGSYTSTATDITSLPTKSEVLTFVNKYQGRSDFIETVSEASRSDHKWKWDIWRDQSGNKFISFYHDENNANGYDSIYFDSKGIENSNPKTVYPPIESHNGA